MGNDIHSLAREVKKYYSQITAIHENSSLTSIQRDAQLQEIKAKGIDHSFNIYEDSNGKKHYSLSIEFPRWSVSDIGIITDVSPTGKYPFELKIDDNILIEYDPREYNKSHPPEGVIDNKKYLNFQKGAELKFEGEVVFCSFHYQYPDYKLGLFRFRIYGSVVSNNCFIATACFGSYNAPEVLVLRQFRDDKLQSLLLGKIVVKLYYEVSPFFAKLISKSDLLKKIVRKYFLEPIVAQLIRKDIR